MKFVSREGQDQQVAVVEGLGGFPFLVVLIEVATLNRDAIAGEGFTVFRRFVFPYGCLDLTAAGDGQVEAYFGFRF